LKSGHKKPLIKRLLRWLAIAIAFFICASLVVTAALFHQVFGRNDLNVNEISLNYSDIDSNKYPRDTITFQSGKTSLKGYIYNAGNTAEGLILIAHGIASGADSYLPEIMYFIDSGWCVFAFDGTGTRTSDGKGIRGLPQTKLDVRAALDYINSNAALKDYPIVLYGHSMGGYAVTSILGDKRSDISAVVSVSAFNSPLDMMYRQARGIVGGYANIEYPFIALYETILFGKDANTTAVDGINATDTPVMIVYGTADDVVCYDTVAIAAFREKITNLNVVFYECDIEYRNGHDTIQLTREAAQYLVAKREELSALHTQYGKTLPTAEWAAFYEGIDHILMNEVDTDYMQAVVDFFHKWR